MGSPKNPAFREGSRKNNIEGWGLPKIEGVKILPKMTVCQFQGGLARKVGGVFERGRG